MNPLVTNVTCDSNGDWDQNTRDLCGKGNDIIFVFDKNAYQQNCPNKLESRRFEKMFFTVILCSSTIQNGHLALDCLRQIGNTCSFTCNSNYISSITPTTIICTTGGNWNRDTATLCNRKAISIFLIWYNVYFLSTNIWLGRCR